MLPDPPHKKGYHSIHSKNKTFVSWKDMKHYQQKVGKLSSFLEKKEDFMRKKNYRKDLDTLLQIKNIGDDKDSKKERDFILSTQKICNSYENKQGNFQKRMLMDNLNKNLENQKNRENRLNLKKQNDKENFNRKLNQDKKTQNMRNSMLFENKKKQGQEMKKYLDFKNMKKVQNNILFKQKNKQLSDLEQQKITQMIQKNKLFYKRIREMDLNPKTKEVYKKMMQERDQKIKETNFFLIEKPVLKKLQKELEEEEYELKNKMNFKNENRFFLAKQIKNNELKKELLKYEEDKFDNQIIQQEIDKQDLKDKSFKKKYKKKLEVTLNTIKKQIEESKQKLLGINYLNENEANHNNKETIKIDFKNPCNGLIGGLPGFVRPSDRVRQLEMIKNTMFNYNVNNFNGGIKKKRYSVCLKKKMGDVKYNESLFKNDYSYMKNKFENRPFDIISNTLKRV